jgi:arylsulfatase
MGRLTSSFGIIAALVFAGCSNDAPQTSQIPEAAPAADSAATQPESRPNILLIVADDLGFTDLGAFGSEIPTPNLDRLAYQGVRLTNLHNGPACQQTRIMLMSGRGNSSMMDNHPPRPSRQRTNSLTMSVAALPELMKDAGYSTFMAGKWDLGLYGEARPAERGFDRSFVLLEASASHFAEPLWGDGSYYEDDGVPVAFEDLPEGFYSTRDYTDKMLGYLEEHDGSNPWFAFMPYTAPHWPLQLPDDWIDRNAGKYDAGWDVLREERATRAEALGIVPDDAMDSFEPLAVPWSSLSAEEKTKYARAQEIYAGMVEYLDLSIGRIFNHLEESGQLDSTVIVFMSDHGASASEHGVSTGRGYTGGGPQIPETRDNSFENFGRPLSFIDHGLGFGEAASAPLKYFKGRLAEGGLRAAAFVRYPGVISQGGVDDTFITAMDIVPTFLDIAGREHPGAGNYKGREILPIAGETFWPYLSGESGTVHSPDYAAGWTAGNTGAIIRGNYKATNHAPPVLESDFATGMGMGMGPPPPWELYDLSVDPGETNDLAATHPDVLADLVSEWQSNWQ